MPNQKYFLLTLLFLPIWLFSQDINGTWKGKLKVGNNELDIVFNVKKDKTGYVTKMDSPAQNAYGIIVNQTKFEDSLISFEVKKPKLSFSGKVINDKTITGNFKQGSMSIPLELVKSDAVKKENLRPQEPLEPFPYSSEEVIFRNKKAEINLRGTLTKPKNDKFSTVIILLSGSGPQNRNEEAFGHKPFLVISDYLTRNGIAVLRYDDRGTSESDGDYKSASLKDFASDALSAIDYFKSKEEFESKKIGIIGHSEGGTIAPMIAKRSKAVDFIISLAGTALPGDEILLIQQRLGGIDAGASEETIKKSQNISRGAYDLIKKHKNSKILKARLKDYIIKAVEQTNSESNSEKQMTFVTRQVEKLSSPWMTSFVRYNPSKDISKLKIPFIALYGDKDCQVTSEENIEALNNADGSKQNISIVEFQSVNHLFQECQTGSPNEYAKIKQTISPKVLEVILDFILKQ